jgi:hypothetical protein
MSAGGTIGEKMVTGTMDAVVKFDLALMSQAANYINNEYTTLAESVRTASDKFKEYISTDAGTAIKTPVAAGNIVSTWDSAIDTKLDDFVKNFNTWSEVMALVNATGAEYADDTVATYTDENGNPMVAAGEGTIEGLQASIGLEGREKIEDILTADTNYTERSWERATSGLSEEERAALTQRNEDTASGLQATYNRLQTMKKSDPSYNTIKKTIEDQNPEVRAILEQQWEDQDS